MPLLLSLMVSHWQLGEVPLPSARITQSNRNSLNFETSGHFHLQHRFLRHLTFWKINIHQNTSILYSGMVRFLRAIIMVNLCFTHQQMNKQNQQSVKKWHLCTMVQRCLLKLAGLAATPGPSCPLTPLFTSTGDRLMEFQLRGVKAAD